MSENNRFGLGPVTELDRKLAATEVEHARATGEYDSEEAARRLARVRLATTHTALRVAVRGRGEGMVPPVLHVAPQVAGALWVFLSVANFVVWLLIGLIDGQWNPLWLICVVLGSGVLVAGVWAARDRVRRLRIAADGAA
ncbi:hypothetical protein [Umezawaea sp. Da 62-37]|uniref:hypothetical protein n=1 Tax=Umezawaea sp. Da 62-37 TaxID=3075927 RepID=UPI0028F73BA8|nr:hypothetical protein [Umezawaea sp. Da 62-37]WNV85370.1 hypothetical protein RM788_45845 [Umezawaea sp. Da 62-37]